MANAERGEVSLEVQGKRYTLKPTFNALCELEDLTGKVFSDIATKAAKGSVSAVRQLVWAYLQEYHGDEIKSVRDAGTWVLDAGGLGRVSEALERLNRLNTEDAKGEDRPPGAAGPGARLKSKPAAVA